MSDGIYVALSGALGRTRQLDVSANNLANLETTAFRRQQVSFRDFVAAPEVLGHSQAPDAKSLPGGRQDIELVHSLPNATTSSQRAGRLTETDEPLDFALEGPGYFAIKTASGPVYTRDGHFTRDENGHLRTLDGASVLGRRGPIKLPEGTVEVSAKGVIEVDGRKVDTLKLVDFPREAKLRQIGANRFDSQSKPVASKAKVHQGHLESSNVNPLQELVELIELQRSFEATWKVVQTYREMDGLAVEIGKP